jgi:hypothetical protein
MHRRATTSLPGTSFHHQPEAQHPKSSAVHKLGRPITPSIVRTTRTRRSPALGIPAAALSSYRPEITAQFRTIPPDLVASFATLGGREQRVCNIAPRNSQQFLQLIGSTLSIVRRCHPRQSLTLHDALQGTNSNAGARRRPDWITRRQCVYSGGLNNAHGVHSPVEGSSAASKRTPREFERRTASWRWKTTFSTCRNGQMPRLVGGRSISQSGS